MIPNISNINFTSTYKVSNYNNSKDGFLKFEDLCDSMDKKDTSSVWYDESISSKDLIWHKMYTLVVDNDKDSEVETYCYNHGIQFKKYRNNELMSNVREIKERIKPPVIGVLKEVDSDKLIELAKRQDSNFYDTKEAYKNFNKTRVDNMIKSGLEFPTSTLRILNNDNTKSNLEMLELIDNKGSEALKPRQLSINFIQMTNEPDDNVFYGFYNLGLRNIPLYMDKKTLQYAKTLDILAED